MNAAIYAGSFDPFTNGHLSVLLQAAQIFDKVVLVIADNPEKYRKYPLGRMKIAIDNILKDYAQNNIDICYTNKLISDFALSIDASYLVRGLRNPNDFVYEENIAKINKELNPDLHTIYIRADDEIISSSMVRELFAHNKDISKYVSKHVLEVMRAVK